MSDEPRLTAPALLGMHSRAATVMAAAAVVIVVLSTTATPTGVEHPTLLVCGVVVSAVGAVVLLRNRVDPMPLATAYGVAATGPLACLLTALALPGPPADASQLNSFGVSVAVYAFLCVCGRTAIAIAAFVAMSAILIVWSVLTGQGAYGLLFALPNAAVLGMSTLFALVVRPAAARIRELTEQSLTETRNLAATAAREREATKRRDELRSTAWPILHTIAARPRMTPGEVAETGLTEKYLRDRIRAPRLDEPTIGAAVRRARLRGVQVVLLDDGVGDENEQAALPTELTDLAVQWLDGATGGRMTIRLHPPGREIAASIAADSHDCEQRIDIDHSGRRHISGPTVHPHD